MRDSRNPKRENPRNRAKYVITEGPWKGETVTPIAETETPGILLAEDGKGRYIQIHTKNLRPAPKASTLGQKGTA